MRASDGGDLTRLTTVPAGMGDLPGDFSPDGGQFVFKRATDEAAGPLMIVDVGGRAPQPLSDMPFGDPGRFSPDGTSVLTSAGNEIMLVDLDGTVVETIAEPGAVLFGPVWSPDGEWDGVLPWRGWAVRRCLHQQGRRLRPGPDHRHGCQRDPSRMGSRGTVIMDQSIGCRHGLASVQSLVE